MKLRPALFVLLVLARLPGSAAAAGEPAAAARAGALRLEKPRAGELLAASFAVGTPVEVVVEAVGCVPSLSEEYLATAWILDAGTRRPVWSLADRAREPAPDDRHLRVADDRLRLAPGRYALYLFGGTQARGEAPFRRLGNVLNDLADLISHDNPGRDPQPYFDRCFVAVSPAPGASAGALAPLTAAPGATAPGEPAAGALLDLTRAPGDTVLARAFRLARPTALRLRAYAEAGGDSTRLHDWAWIEDAATGAPAWLLDAARTRPAGGARKNRVFEGEVRLPAGDYVARFVTDDSHAWGAWNAAPPPDPDAWGLAIFPGEGGAAGDLQPLGLDAVRRAPDRLATLTMVRNREDRRQEFALAGATRVRLEALLEGLDDSMADRAWIAEAATGRRIWTLDYAATAPAGGADKNRRFTGEIDLPAGRYIAHVRCDDSHAFGGWNADPPPEAWRWGLVVTVAGR
ncbi:MAG: hypothetical protein ACYDIE_12490 [Candidatus Krumholzibacteriia bacterium]